MRVAIQLALILAILSASNVTLAADQGDDQPDKLKGQEVQRLLHLKNPTKLDRQEIQKLRFRKNPDGTYDVRLADGSWYSTERLGLRVLEDVRPSRLSTNELPKPKPYGITLTFDPKNRTLREK